MDSTNGVSATEVFDVFCYVKWDKLLNKQSSCRWFETKSCSCDIIVMISFIHMYFLFMSQSGRQLPSKLNMIASWCWITRECCNVVIVWSKRPGKHHQEIWSCIAPRKQNRQYTIIMSQLKLKYCLIPRVWFGMWIASSCGIQYAHERLIHNG